MTIVISPWPTVASSSTVAGLSLTPQVSWRGRSLQSYEHDCSGWSDEQRCYASTRPAVDGLFPADVLVEPGPGYGQHARTDREHELGADRNLASPGPRTCRYVHARLVPKNHRRAGASRRCSQYRPAVPTQL